MGAVVSTQGTKAYTTCFKTRNFLRLSCKVNCEDSVIVVVGLSLSLKPKVTIEPNFFWKELKNRNVYPEKLGYLETKADHEEVSAIYRQNLEARKHLNISIAENIVCPEN